MDFLRTLKNKKDDDWNYEEELGLDSSLKNEGSQMESSRGISGEGEREKGNFDWPNARNVERGQEEEKKVNGQQDKQLLPGISFASLDMCSEDHGRYSCMENSNCSDSICKRIDRKTGRRSKYRFQSRLKEFKETTNDRQTVIRGILKRMNLKEKTIMIMIVNSGFAHLFGNWYCSLLANHVDVERIKARTLVLTADINATAFVRGMGFFTADDDEMKILLKWTNRQVLSIPAISFGRGSHTTLNLVLKFAMPYDLIHLGYNVAIQDVDFIWTQDAFEIMVNGCNEADCDVAFIGEGRVFNQADFTPDLGEGPITRIDWTRSTENKNTWELQEVNTGMFYLKASPQTEQLTSTIVEGHHLQVWKGRDQPLWNSVVYHKSFSHLNIFILPENRFIPGTQLHRSDWKNQALNPLMLQQQQTEEATDNKRIVAIHVSDTASYTNKIEKMKATGSWFFSDRLTSSPNACAAAVTLCKQLKGCWEPIVGYTKETLPEFLDDSDPAWIKHVKQQHVIVN